MLKGGLGTAVIEAVNDSELKDIKVKTFGYNDCFVKHGSTEEIEKIYKLSSDNIAESVKKHII